MEHIAQLAYLNKDHLLFFRGQAADHPNTRGASSLYPQIYRGDRVTRDELELRFDLLLASCQRLCDALLRHGIKTYPDIRRRRYVQWSILQHYEVCPTPFLDLTHSPRVACSFAFLADDGERGGVFYVLGLPYLTNRVSVNSEQDIVNVRLLSICPPEALRPYFQDGYVVATDEVTTEFTSKSELDFNRRLIAKFRLPPAKQFWDQELGGIPRPLLYPASDIMQAVCTELREEVGTDVQPGRLGQFLQEWVRVESMLRVLAEAYGFRSYTTREAVDLFRRREYLPSDILQQLDSLRQLRNRAVHRPHETRPEEILRATRDLRGLVSRMNEKLTE